MAFLLSDHDQLPPSTGFWELIYKKSFMISGPAVVGMVDDNTFAYDGTRA